MIRWPLYLLPIAFINQLLAPHPVWMVFTATLVGLYGSAYFWVRHQAPLVLIERRREGSIVTAGDVLDERFELVNPSALPVLWAEYRRGSNLPGARTGWVVASASNNVYSWQSKVECRQRGLYQLGPSFLTWADPLILFQIEREFPETETIIIYPRIVHLPRVEIPAGSDRGTLQRVRPLHGTQRSTSVRDYQPGDSLRHIHWPSTAHRNSLMVTELDTEPGGEVWIVLDLDHAVYKQSEVEGGDDERSDNNPLPDIERDAAAYINDTFEFGVVVAASLAAQLLNDHNRQKVGLLTSSGHNVADVNSLLFSDAAQNNEMPWSQRNRLSRPPSRSTTVPASNNETKDDLEDSTIILPPQMGQIQQWGIMTVLAPVRESDISLATLLRSNRSLLGRGRTVIVVTPVSTISQSINVEKDGHANGDSDARVPKSDKVESNWAETEQPDGQRSDRNSLQQKPLEDWITELMHIQDRASCTVVLVDSEDVDLENVETEDFESNRQDFTNVTSERESVQTHRLQQILAQYDITSSVLQSSNSYRPLVTHTRTRTVIRTTPTGGAISVEVEEEVG
ncbi:DUF58 domain-containing protein [Chloroflexi bacterium TSY]|nr:DUF58 domain-containing protein [Chloroflexi bacterium TSY]